MVTTKLKVFLWRLAHHSLPTKDVRKHKHMSDRDECMVCGMQDSWRHGLIECTMARCVWALVDQELMEHMMATPEPLACNWLFYMVDVLPHKDLTRLVVTLWVVWTVRRKLIHEGINQSPL